MNIQLDQTNTDVFVDAFILTEGMSEEDKQILSDSEFSFDKTESPICCCDFVVDQTFYEYMMTGYGRIVIHDVNKGIISFKEGHFKNGK